jgi:ribosomal protein S27AE
MEIPFSKLLHIEAEIFEDSSQQESLFNHEVTPQEVDINKRTCPCCSTVLLRHIRAGRIYWRCSRCRD